MTLITRCFGLIWVLYYFSSFEIHLLQILPLFLWILKVPSEMFENSLLFKDHFKDNASLFSSILQTHMLFGPQCWRSKKSRHAEIVVLEPFITLGITGAFCVNGSWAWHLVLLIRDKVNVLSFLSTAFLYLQMYDAVNFSAQAIFNPCAFMVFIEALWKLLTFSQYC